MRHLRATLGLLALICSFCAGCCTAQRGATNHVPQLEDLTIALVEPDAEDEHGWRIFCTGVWINEHTILTADHCVESHKTPIEKLIDKLMGGGDESVEGSPISYVTRQESAARVAPSRAATVLAVDHDNDLALIYVAKPPPHPSATLASADPQDGDELHIVGHTAGLAWTYTHGYVAAHRKQMDGPHDRKADEMQVSAPIYFGNSGGGAFDSDGNLCGIASYMMKGPDLGFFAPVHVLHKFLRHNGLIK